MWTRLILWLLAMLSRDPRGLFRFFDGRRWRRVDPLEIARAFWAHPKFDWDATPELLKAPNSSIQLQAMKDIAAAVREVFGVKDATNGGLTEIECLDLLTAFKNYLGNVKKNGSIFQILPDSTDTGHSDDIVIPPRPGLASGSTQNEQQPAPLGSPVVPTTAG